MATKTRTAERRVEVLANNLARDPELNEGVKAMRKRESEFSSPLAAKLAGIAAQPMARRRLEDGLDAMWEDDFDRVAYDNGSRTFGEVIVGGGLHAAIYSAVRVARGLPAPLVIEASGRVGGAMAMSRLPSFYLNSRNRPGPLSVPGRPDGALNILPGSILQPSDLSGDEYQRNSDLAFVIRTTLAMNAKVLTRTRVASVGRSNGGSYLQLRLKDRGYIRAQRIILARGLGAPRRLGVPANYKRVMTYPEFMAMMDKPFPLQGMKRVAVIGSGDSARTAIEALVGQGPSTGMSVASLDYPDSIDWYGLPEVYTRSRWEQCNRSRYRGIARVLPVADAFEVSRVRPLIEMAQSISDGFECAFVNEMPYDYVIVCAGFDDPNTAETVLDSSRRDYFQVGGRAVAQRANGREVYLVGPEAQIPIGGNELNAISVNGQSPPENATALFRYASRTAALAASLKA